MNGDDEILIAIAVTEETWDAMHNDTAPCSLERTAEQLGLEAVADGVWAKVVCPDECSNLNKALAQSVAESSDSPDRTAP